MHCTGCDVAAHDADSVEETKKEETKDSHTFLIGDKEVPDIKSIIITLSYIIIAISLPPLGFWVLETQNKYIYFTINSFILTTFYPKHKSVSR